MRQRDNKQHEDELSKIKNMSSSWRDFRLATKVMDFGSEMRHNNEDIFQDGSRVGNSRSLERGKVKVV